ncbi:hypothetical protein [Diaphorobacter aerolatus]|uniref:Cyclic di-GMP-binding protein n=1 Tax=Diaphorobacter aerolatus TaxID=1288495 RepID=A0A7H0GPT9_9BURK|nr:hypothetical protein [Diaphorobacter aerolatus]QNP50305.1 hypothetical protein H9K75_11310 [Diaphorobacter aerolatus]
MPWGFGGMALLLTGTLAQASTLSNDLQLLTQGQRFERRISLATMGMPGNAVNVPAGSLQEFYFPAHPSQLSRSLQVVAPANQPAPAFTLNGAAQPVQAATPAQPDQLLRTSLPLNPAATATRLGMQVAPAPQTACDARPAGAVALKSASYLSYYPVAASLPPLEQAWSAQAVAALPEQPFLMVAAPPLSAEAFDTAWRVGVAMARLGRPASIHTLPRVGDKVDTRALSIPPSLAALRAFAGLSDAKEQHTIEDPAEIGALLMLDAGSTLADVVVVDRQLQSQIAQALDALHNQITDADALAVFQRWRDQKMPLAREAALSAPVARMAFGAHPAWAVAVGSAAQVAAISDKPGWLALSAVADGAARLPEQQANHPILRPDSPTSSSQFAVQAPENWSASFALLPPTGASHTPTHVSASFLIPAQTKSQYPVGALRWNGVLLAASRLSAGSERDTLSADIPVYALSDINLLQVSLEQNAPEGDCKQALTVPTTALQLDVRFDAPRQTALPRNPTFADLIPHLGLSAELAVPRDYLVHVRPGLSNAIRMAVAANLSAHSAQLVLVEKNQPYTPARTFVALDVALPGTNRSVNLLGDRVAFRDRSIDDLPWKPTTDVSAVQAVTAGHQAGLLWYPMGEARAAIKPTGLLVNHGQLALLGPNSEVAWINASGSVVHASDANTAGPMYEWRSLFSWGVPVTLGALILFILLLAAATFAARRARNKTTHTEGSP